MQITTDFDIAIGQYIVEASVGTPSDEARDALQAAIGNDPDNYITAFNLIAVTAQKRLTARDCTMSAAVEAARAEYKSLNLGKTFCAFDYAEPLLEMVLDRAGFAQKPPKEQVAYLDAALKKGELCPYVPLRNGIRMYILRSVLRFGLATQDIEFATKVMQGINGMSAEEKAAAIIPACFVQEI